MLITVIKWVNDATSGSDPGAPNTWAGRVVDRQPRSPGERGQGGFGQKNIVVLRKYFLGCLTENLRPSSSERGGRQDGGPFCIPALVEATCLVNGRWYCSNITENRWSHVFR